MVKPNPGDNVLVQLAPNLYELRRRAEPAPTVVVARATDAQATQGTSPAAMSDAAPVAKPVAKSKRRVAASKRAPKAVPATQVAGLEVSNGAGIRYLAQRTAEKLSELGLAVVRITNYPVFSKEQSEIHYRSGHLEEARAMQGTLPVDAKLVNAKHLRRGVNVRLVLGKDLGSQQVARVDSGVSATGDVARQKPRPETPIVERPPMDAQAGPEKVARAGRGTGWRFL